MEKDNRKNIIMIILIVVSLISISLSIYTLNRKTGYYVGKIESIDRNGENTIVEISPVSSNRKYISEIEENHRLEYGSSTDIIGISAPRRKKVKKLHLGEMDEMVQSLKVGDNFIFTIRDETYNKEQYKLNIDDILLDLTIE